MNPLQRLTAVPKARRFRALLPLIEAKIKEGVRHADIMQALEEQGLSLCENTYFKYLRRYRSVSAGTTKQPQHHSGALVRPTAFQGKTETRSPADQSDSVSTRPATFDYNPRGIPDLLK